MHNRNGNIYNNNNDTVSKQNIARGRLNKIKYGTDIRFATLNIRGIKRLGKREKIEHWMNKQKILILLLQETHVNQNVREIRKTIPGFLQGTQRKTGEKTTQKRE